MGTVTCPRCGRNEYTPYGEPWDPERDAPPPALSRMDNATYICSDCGQDEAMRDFSGERMPYHPDMPMSREEFREFQDSDHNGIVVLFAVIGVTSWTTHIPATCGKAKGEGVDPPPLTH